MCLIVALGLLFVFISHMFFLEALFTNSPNVRTPPDVTDQISWLLRYLNVFSILTSTTLFAVKFSFLFLFKNLIRNVRNMKIYWWIVILTTGATWLFVIVEFFLLCPNLSFQCLNTFTYSKLLGWSVAITVEDILTDLMSL